MEKNEIIRKTTANRLADQLHNKSKEPCLALLLSLALSSENLSHLVFLILEIESIRSVRHSRFCTKTTITKRKSMEMVFNNTINENVTEKFETVFELIAKMYVLKPFNT
jgi:hypothetical protein